MRIFLYGSSNLSASVEIKNIMLLNIIEVDGILIGVAIISFILIIALLIFTDWDIFNNK